MSIKQELLELKNICKERGLKEALPKINWLLRTLCNYYDTYSTRNLIAELDKSEDVEGLFKLYLKEDREHIKSEINLLVISHGVGMATLKKLHSKKRLKYVNNLCLLTAKGVQKKSIEILESSLPIVSACILDLQVRDTFTIVLEEEDTTIELNISPLRTKIIAQKGEEISTFELVHGGEGSTEVNASNIPLCNQVLELFNIEYA